MFGNAIIFEKSTENVSTTGLGIINGDVKKLSTKQDDILPNVGWFETNINPSTSFNFLKEFDKQRFYYVHSYVAEPTEKINQLQHLLIKEKIFVQ